MYERLIFSSTEGLFSDELYVSKVSNLLLVLFAFNLPYAEPRADGTTSLSGVVKGAAGGRISCATSGAAWAERSVSLHGVLTKDWTE
jgi:hypothetical protein